MGEITNTNIDGLQREKANVGLELQRVEDDLKEAKGADDKDKVRIAELEVRQEELQQRAKSVKEQLDAIDEAVESAAK